MTKDDILKVCQLSMLWYYIQVFENEDQAREYAKTHMPDFADGRIEFIEKEFNK